MKALSFDKNIKYRPEIIQAKRFYGAIYGAVAGLAFATTAWGWDSYLLSQAHAFYPWIKMIVGGVMCACVGGVASWLAARLDKSALSILFWILVSIVFSWLTVALPLHIAPAISAMLNPKIGELLNYNMNDNYMVRLAVAFGAIVIFSAIVGVLQFPLVEPAVFSPSIFGKIVPSLVAIVILGVCGTLADNLNNEPLRQSVISLDRTIQFAIDNQGVKVDPAVSRQMHLASLSTIKEYVKPSRHLIVRSFDEYLGQIEVVVQFDGTWVNCSVIYGQPSICQLLK